MDKTTNAGEFTNTPHVTDRAGSDAIGGDMSTSGGISSKLSGSSLGDARTAIMEQARPAVDYVRNNFKPVMDNSQRYLTDARGIITQHPFYAIAGAVAIGMFAGMMFSRSSRRY